MRRILAILLLLAGSSILLARAGWLDRDQGTGDWAGRRTHLAERGLEVEVVYTGDFFSSLSGGRRRASEYLDNVDLIASLHAERLLGWRGTTFLIYVLGNHGGSPSGNVGDIQGVDNIEALRTWKIYEAWIEHELLENRFSLLFGLYDLNSEFDVIETAKLFINSSHGIGPDFSQSGVNGPSIFPATSLAVRARYKPRDWVYFQAAVLDAVPGDPNSPRGTHVQIRESEGALLAIELGLSVRGARGAPVDLERQRHRRIGRFEDAEYRGKYGLGFWTYTAPFDDVLDRDSSGDPRQRRGNRGVYVLAERVLVPAAGHPSRGLSVFGRLGAADTRINRLGLYAGAGATWTGILAGRPRDSIGFSVASARNGSDFRDAQEREGIPARRAETALEATYRAELAPWLALQPDLQYVVHPGAEPGLDNALVIGLRAEISF